MSIRPVADPDFWWHLRTGQWIVETKDIPRIDPFSSTVTGKTWIAHEWLTDFFIYLLFKMGGFTILILIFSFLITLSFFLVYLRSSGKPYTAGFVILLSALASAPTWGVRPQILTVFLTSVYLFILGNYHINKNWKTLIPLTFLTILWVNLHAGYFLGFIIIGIYLLDELVGIYTNKNIKDRPDFHPVINLSIVLLVCILGSILNPYNFQILIFPFETLTSDTIMKYIQEWFSPDFHQPEWIPLAILILSLVALSLMSRQKVPLVQILLVTCFGFAALRSMRHVPLFALTAVPILSRQINGLIPNKVILQKQSVRNLWLNLTLLIFFVLSIGIFAWSQFEKQSTSEAKTFPLTSVIWILENHPTGNIYNTFGWGGYLIWKLYPEYSVYIDGRAEIYGDEFINDYLRIYNGQDDWEETFEFANIGIVLIEQDSSLSAFLDQSSAWKIVHQDDMSVLYIRK